MSRRLLISLNLRRQVLKRCRSVLLISEVAPASSLLLVDVCVLDNFPLYSTLQGDLGDIKTVALSLRVPRRHL
ncbi:hypothetical protein J6590_072400 [Homalodisca vitripennis]|nr:hypothetical protein J6590_072400 [Homalodisca vitripennis]